MNKKKISLVQVLPKKSKPHNTLARVVDTDESVIAVFRGGRIYRPYEYRTGLRFQRLLRILGRHA